MNPTGDILQFARLADGARSVNALQVLIERAIKKLGIEYYSFAHHVIILDAPGDTVFLNNYPESWAATVHVHKYMRDDPIVEICARQTAPFRWSEIASLMKMSPRQREIMREAGRAGLVNGYTVPIHKPGQPVASCSFSTRGEIAADVLLAVTWIAIAAFDAAHRLVRRGAAASAGRPRLAKRERDCILLAGRGLSDAEASQVLGIGEAAVSAHIEDARRKYGAASRMELIVRALYRAELDFADLIDVEDELSGRAVARRREAADEEPAPMARLGALFFGTNPDLN